ncbi:MAG: ECF-type sigma factor [Planctomycetota bacterium]
MRFFGGCSVEETARILDVSKGQVKRDWVTARAFLLSRLQENDDGR